MKDKPLRIAFITGGFPYPSETFISRKVESLINAGHTVKVFCSQFNRSMQGSEKFQSVVCEIPHTVRKYQPSLLMLPFDFMKAIVHRPSFLWQARKGLRGNVQQIALLSRFYPTSWDIIHAHYLQNVGMFRNCFLQSQMPPIVAGVYGFDVSILPHNKGGKEQTLRYVEAASGIVYTSGFLQKTLREIVESSVPEAVIYPEVPLDTFKFRKRERCSSPCRILSVGRLNWAKGYQFSLAAIRLLIDKGVDCQYRIIGEGSARDELEYSIRTLGLQDNVSLLGVKTGPQVAEETDSADVFLLTSIREDFGVVLLEAQSAGLPIVASRVGGTPEAVIDGQTALLVPPRNPTAIAEALLRLINDGDLYKKLSENGPSKVKQNDMTHITNQLVDFYRKIIEHTREKNNK